MIAAGDGRPLLAGVRVIDLTTVVFGPYATQMLADLGADVIKVEAPAGGDILRWTALGARTPGMSPAFMAINRGKRSIALDLKIADDLAVLHDLLATADAFVVNVRGKALARLGLDYAAVAAIAPDIVYAHCVGFGQDGPYADLPAYDDVIQAASGTTSLLPRADGDPRPRYLPSLIADKVSGLHAAYGVLAALVHKLRTGRGQFVEIPMFEAFTRFMLVEHLGGLTFDPPVGPAGYQRQVDPDRQPLPTADGYISIVAYDDAAWPRLFALLGHPEFLADPRFADRRGRVVHLAALQQELARLTPAFTTADLLSRCHAAAIPAQPARDLADILADPHLAATGAFERSTHPSEGNIVAVRPPVRFGDAPLPPCGPAPRLGEHGDAIRAEVRGG